MARYSQSSDSEVRKLLRQPLMRTSESKELWKFIVSGAAFEFEGPMRRMRPH
jgi:hypothetical protein